MSQFIEMRNHTTTTRKKVGEVAKVMTGSTPSRNHPEYWGGSNYWVAAQDMGGKYVTDTLEKVTDEGYATCKVVPAGSVLYVCRGSIGVISINTMDCATNQSICTATCNDGYINEYLYYALKFAEGDIKKQGTGTSFKSLNQSSFAAIELDFPSIDDQKAFAEIARQADKSEFDGLKSQFIEMFNGEFPMERWEECLTITNGKKYDGEYQETGTYPICGSGGIMGYGDQKLCPKNTVILGRKGNINSPIYMESDYWIVDTAFCLDVDKQKLLPKFFYYWCVLFDFTRYNKQGVLPSLTKNDLLKIEIPIPPMDLQTKFVNIQNQADKSESAQELVRNINYN